MVAGFGIDIVDITRFEKAVRQWGDNFLRKIFTEKELEYAVGKKTYFIHMAGKFAAKEAVKKALPNGTEVGLNWPDIEILNDKEGKPYVSLHGSAKALMDRFNLAKILISISHTEDTAVSGAIGIGR